MQARITLARAVYSKAEVVLLDDVLSALDVHTSKWVAEKCLGGDLLEGRTVLLVTHNVLLAETVSDYVVSIGLDGKIASQGSVKDALEKNSHLRKQVSKAMKAEDAAEPVQKAAKDEEPAVDKPDEKSKGKLIVAEEMAIGHVSWKAGQYNLNSVGCLAR
jgi:ABC-type nitrate/sulfonate/bicarbonate transport system ATPase subunit